MRHTCFYFRKEIHKKAVLTIRTAPVILLDKSVLLAENRRFCQVVWLDILL